ncbi:MAG: hypothetical protein M0P31_02915 [Solirubrobacteraceae bacterium]|nr:hypothetical protein [Solirubrobacteraceae bacterium]
MSIPQDRPDVTGAEHPVDLVASVGPLDATVALLRELLHAARATQAIAVVAAGPDDPDGEPATVDVERLAPVEVTIGPHVMHLPHAIELDVEVPPLPEFQALPPFDADPETGDVAAPLGGVEHYAREAQRAAALLGPADVLQLRWDTTRPQTPFSVTVRGDGGEPVVLGVGEETFPMPEGWPDAATLETRIVDRPADGR